MWLILSSPKAGFISGLFVCPGLEDSWQPPIYLWWTSISLCKAGRQRDEQLTSSAGSGQGWAIVMNIMCKYERRETKGWFCYGNVVIGADWVVICCVCVSECVFVFTHVSACVWAAACKLETRLDNCFTCAHQVSIRRAKFHVILITSHQLTG